MKKSLMDLAAVQIESSVLEWSTSLKKDIAVKLAEDLNDKEVCELVDLYYQIQQFRIGTANQVRSIEKTEEQSNTLKLFRDNFKLIEENISKVLNEFTKLSPLGLWATGICGIGPIIAAGLIANLDVKNKPTAGHFWSYCGLNDNNRPWLGREKTKKIVDEVLGSKQSKDINYEDFCTICAKTQWNPDNVIKTTDKSGNFIFIEDDKYKFTKDSIVKVLSKRPYNARLKTLCWKLGQSFVKVSNSPKDIYGKIYQKRKALEMQKNEKGEYSKQAEEKLRKYNIGKTTDAHKYYIEGKLPPAHIQSRCERYTVKIFLSHLHRVMYILEYGMEPPKPFAISILGHAHEIECPQIDEIKRIVGI